MNPVKSLNILLVEDSESDALLLQEEILMSGIEDFRISVVQSLQDAASYLKKNHVDATLLDLSLPDSSGLETVLRVRNVRSDVPIVVLTGVEDEKMGVEAVRMGAQDYLVKGRANGRLIARAVHYAIERNQAEKEIENLAKFPSEDPYPVLRISGDGTIMYSNEPGTTLLKKWEKSVGGKVDEKWCSLISQVLSSNIEKIIEITCEYRVISFVITPIAEAGYVNLYGRDITVQQQVKKELQQILKNLESQVKERTKILSRTVTTLQTEVEDRIAAERNADERARILDAFFGHTITPLVFLDRKFNFIRVNDAYARACQRNAPEFVGHNHFEFYPNEENQRIFENVVRTKLHYEVTAKPFSFPDHPEWGVTYWDWTLIPILDDAGEVEFLVFSLEDVTGRFKAENQTRITNVLLELFTKKTSRKEYLDSAVEAIRNWSGCRCAGIRIVDSQGYIPYESCIGFSEDFLELENMLCLNKDTCACIRIINRTAEPQDKTVMTPRGSFCCENSFKFIKKLTKKQQARFRGNCVRKGFASIAVVPISYRDEMLGAIHLTDEQPNKISIETIQFIEKMSFLIGEAVHRFNVETDLRQSEDRYRSLVELAPDGIGVESDNRIVFINTVGAKILGCDNPAEIIGRPAMDFVHPDYVKRAQRQLLYLQRKKRELTLNEIKLLRVDGTVFNAEMAAMPLVYQNKPAAQIVFHDITERKQAEEKILADQERLRSLTTELILTEERERRAIAAALHDSLGPLLAFSKRELGVLQKSAPAELTGTLDNIREFIKQAIEQTRELTFDLSPPTLYTFGLEHALEELIEHFSEENKLKCVFRNSAKIKSLPDDIKILLYRSVHELLINMAKHARAKSAQVTLSTIEDNIQITVEDDGAGFDMADIDPQTGKSSGFGLFSIRQRLAQVGGRLDIQSQKGRGTKVVLLSPLKLKKTQKRRTKL